MRSDSSPPGWTLTPLFQEVQRLKELCTRLALENAAITAMLPQLRSECNCLSVSVADLSTRLSEVERHRLGELRSAHVDVVALVSAKHEEMQNEMEAVKMESARQRAETAKLQDQVMNALTARLEQHERDSNGAMERTFESLQTLRGQVEAARHELREEFAAEVRTLRDEGAHEARIRAEGHDGLCEGIAALRSECDERAEGTSRSIAVASESVSRSVDTKVAKVNSTLLRLDRLAREHEQALGEGHEDVVRRTQEAREERQRLENQLATLECRLTQVERSCSANENLL